MSCIYYDIIYLSSIILFVGVAMAAKLNHRNNHHHTTTAVMSNFSSITTGSSSNNNNDTNIIRDNSTTTTIILDSNCIKESGNNNVNDTIDRNHIIVDGVIDDDNDQSDFEACMTIATDCLLDNYHNLSSIVNINSSIINRVDVMITLVYDNDERDSNCEIIG